MKLLLDAGIFIHAETGTLETREVELRWGPRSVVVPISRTVRKPPHKDTSRQAELDALLTIARLIREGRVQAFSYREVMVELFRGANAYVANAFQNCEIHRCAPALERSKFRGTGDIREAHAKGGRKDRGTQYQNSEHTQLGFLSWLKALKPEHVALLISHAETIGLSHFEKESLADLRWFQVMCDRSGSEENYVDVFHLWTAARNGFGLLTLDGKLKKLAERVRGENACPVKELPDVFTPLDLLHVVGVKPSGSQPRSPRDI